MLEGVGRVLLYVIILVAYIALSYTLFKFVRWGFYALQPLIVSLLVLWSVRCYLLTPAMTTVGLRYIELRHNDAIGKAITTALGNLDAGLSVQQEGHMRNIGVLRSSLDDIYTLYAGMYLLQNGSLNHVLTAAFTEFYYDLKLLMALMSKVALPIHKPESIRMEVFHDMVPFIREGFEARPLFDSIWLRPAVRHSQVSLLAALYRANMNMITDVEISLALSKVERLPEIKTISALCKGLMHRIVGLTERHTEGSRMTQAIYSPRPTFGSYRLQKYMALFRFMGKLEQFHVQKNFPNFHTTIDAMLIANKTLVKEAEAKQRQITDFHPDDKDLYAQLSMLHGTDIFELLYSEGYEERFSQHPMVLMFNNNSECYEFKVGVPYEIYEHMARGRNVYMFNYAQVCDSRGETIQSSLFHDAKMLAESLLRRFGYNFPNGNKFKLAFHGASLGGMFATVTASSLEKEHPSSMLDFAILQKTFGSLYDMAWHNLSVLGGVMARFYGVSIDLYNRYVDLRMPKLNVYEVNDAVIPSYYSLSGHVSKTYFGDLLKPLLQEFKELVDLYHEVPKENLSQICVAFHAINSAGQHLGDSNRGLNSNWHRHDGYVSTFMARVVAFGSVPAKKMVDNHTALRLPQLWDILLKCPFKGITATDADGRKYLKVPANIAALFNMFLLGNAAFEQGSGLHDTILAPGTRQPVHSDATHLGNVRDVKAYEIEWPDRIRDYKEQPIVVSDSTHDMISDDLQAFGIQQPQIDGVRLYAWMQLYNLLHTVALVHAARLQNDGDMSSMVETFATANMKLSFGIDPNEDSPPTTQDLSVQLFKERYRAFGNILTTYTRHSLPLETQDMQLVHAVLG
ncbi:uncharacterized protein BBOV_IV002700 [Babesia bovis T2Bo]|uniref:Membrane protein, putative n=1 Tax=Babesia bovis TaxID=5865 RepID=A7AVP1_BABBO|nr:uncharacterized protein BBOV_IV002700 [Babesia bovis T2Bo]EDO05867.1 putative integral membrane protein [Babesia bovis T2Bo]|eukprot:XP_001609435.1 hypothetical protein [Babesia bovis T2Bo]